MKTLNAIPSLALLSTVLCSFLTPVAAWSQIYRWIDEEGITVYSNIPPAKAKKVKDLEVLMEKEKPIPPAEAAQRAIQAAQDEAMRREQALQERVDTLERRLQALQYQEQVAAPPSYVQYESLDPSFGFPYSYGVAYVVPSRVIAPAGVVVVRSPLITSRRVVNSGPVFAAPAVPSSRFVPGVFTPGFTSAKGFTSPHFGSRKFESRAVGGMRRARR